MADKGKKKDEKPEENQEPKAEKKATGESKKDAMINAVKGLQPTNRRMLKGKAYDSVDRAQVIQQIEQILG